ncbi:MAG: DEAD/DEAH box helicase [Acidimicrobiales bacterium]
MSVVLGSVREWAAGVRALFSPAVAEWFTATFREPTPPQAQGWPAISEGDHTLILAPTGTGKTLSAFLWALDRLATEPVPTDPQRARVLYLSPLRALAVDVEKNLRAPSRGSGSPRTGSGSRSTRPRWGFAAATQRRSTGAG